MSHASQTNYNCTPRREKLFICYFYLVNCCHKLLLIENAETLADNIVLALQSRKVYKKKQDRFLDNKDVFFLVIIK